MIRIFLPVISLKLPARGDVRMPIISRFELMALALSSLQEQVDEKHASIISPVVIQMPLADLAII